MPDITQKLRIQIEADNKASAAFSKLGSDAQRTFGNVPSGKIDPKDVMAGRLAGGGGLFGMSVATAAAFGGVTLGIGAVVAAMTDAVGTAANFEQAMANVKAVTGATDAQFKALTAAAKEMGATTQFSASEAASGIRLLGMAGLDTDEILTALPDTLNLAAAGAISLGEAADISTNIVSGMGLEVTDLSHVVDALAQAARSSNTDVSQLGQAYSFAAASAASAGLDFDEVTAALGKMADAGLQATRGGTNLASAITKMLKPSKEAEEVMADLGLRFVDSTGKVRPLVNIVGDLERANISAKDQITLFGSEGQRAINALVQAGSADLAALQEKIKESGGVAESMANIQMATLQGATKELDSAMEGLKITIGELLLPALTGLLDNVITPGISTVNNFVAALQKTEGLDLSDEIRELAGLGVEVNTRVLSIEEQISTLQQKQGEYRLQIASTQLEMGVIFKGVGEVEARLQKVEKDQIETLTTLMAKKKELSESAAIFTGDLKGEIRELENKKDKNAEELESLKKLKGGYDGVATSVDLIRQKREELNTLPELVVEAPDLSAWNASIAETTALLDALPVDFADAIGNTEDALETFEVDPVELGFDDVIVFPEKNESAELVRGRMNDIFEEGLGRMIRTGSFVEGLKSIGTSIMDSIIGGMSKNATQKMTDAIFGGGGDSGGGFSLSALFEKKATETATTFEAAAGPGFEAAGTNMGNMFGSSFQAAATAGVNAALVVAGALIAQKSIRGLAGGIKNAFSGRDYEEELRTTVATMGGEGNLTNQRIGSLRNLRDIAESAGADRLVAELDTMLAGTESVREDTFLSAVIARRAGDGGETAEEYEARMTAAYREYDQLQSEKQAAEHNIAVNLAREEEKRLSSLGHGAGPPPSTPTAQYTPPMATPTPPPSPVPVAPTPVVAPLGLDFNEIVAAGATHEQADVAMHMHYTLGRSLDEVNTALQWFKSDSGKVAFNDAFGSYDTAGAIAHIGKVLTAFGLPGYKHGGSFMVPGAGPPDSHLVSFMATPGERVDVTPPGGGFVGGGSNEKQTIIVLNTTVQMLDPTDADIVISERLGPRIVEYLRRESEAGREVLYQDGVVDPVTV